METKWIEKTNSKIAAEILINQGIIGIPTDTVFGLSVLANNEKGIKKLREIKKRPDDKALAYMVNSIEMIEQVCKLTDRDRLLIKTFMPGAVTFIFNKKENLKIFDESGLNTLAIRIPNHPFILELINYLDVGLYVPSANISSFPPAKTYQEVGEIFGEKIEGIVMDESYLGQASTIVDCSKTELKLLREGPIPYQEIVNATKNI